MKKIVIRSQGAPEVLEWIDLPEPAPNEEEVLVAIEAIGMNWSEVMIRSGSWPIEIAEGFTPGSEAAGVVEKVGAGVDDLRPGEKVLVFDMSSYERETQGCYAEKISVSRDRILKYPQHLDFPEAAAVPMAALTAFDVLVNHTPLPETGTVVITACTGAVGIAAIQIAKRKGLRVIGATRSPSKKSFVHSLGAEAVVAQDAQSLKKNILEMVGDGGVDYIFDPVNGETATQLISLLNFEGHYVCYGFLGGDHFQVSSAFLFHQVSIHGYVILRNLADPQELQAVWNEVLPLIEAKEIEIPVAKTFALADAAGAQRAMEAAKHIGKLVMIP